MNSNLDRKWCLYDVKDDQILATGSFIEMEDLESSWAGNVIVATVHGINKYRQKAKSRNNQ